MRDLAPIAPVELFRSRDRGAPIRAGEDSGGVHCARKVTAGQAELRLLRPRHALSHGRRTLQSHGRHRCRACALSQQRRGAQRRDRRSGADDDRRSSRNGAECCGRSGPRAGHHRQITLNRAAQSADRARSRRFRIRSHDLAGVDGSGGHTEADHRQAQCRRERRHQAAGYRQAVDRTGRGSDVDESRKSSTNSCAPIL